MEKKTYSEKLKDPRWQKKRLEILQRDEWACVRCGDKESTLHIHHMRYIHGKEPWEYENEKLMTLCEGCHENEKDSRVEYEKDLLAILKDFGFMADDVYAISIGLLRLSSLYPPDVTATIIEKTLSDPILWDKACKGYFHSISGGGE